MYVAKSVHRVVGHLCMRLLDMGVEVRSAGDAGKNEPDLYLYLCVALLHLALSIAEAEAQDVCVN